MQENFDSNEDLNHGESITRVTGMYKDWFLDYASYVILERAVPSVEDGFKPVQRRIMQSMKDLDDGKTPTLPQRMMVMRIFDKLLKLIMYNKEVYQRVLQTVKKGKKMKKEAFEATHTIVEHKGKRFYVGENNELVAYEG